MSIRALIIVAMFVPIANQCAMHLSKEPESGTLVIESAERRANVIAQLDKRARELGNEKNAELVQQLEDLFLETAGLQRAHSEPAVLPSALKGKSASKARSKDVRFANVLFADDQSYK